MSGEAGVAADDPRLPEQWSNAENGELGADTSLGIPGIIHERLRGLLATQ